MTGNFDTTNQILSLTLVFNSINDSSSDTDDWWYQGYMIKHLMLMISDCSAVTHCEKCNALDDKIKCARCKTGFSLLRNNTCQGIASDIDAC